MCVRHLAHSASAGRLGPRHSRFRSGTPRRRPGLWSARPCQHPWQLQSQPQTQPGTAGRTRVQTTARRPNVRGGWTAPPRPSGLSMHLPRAQRPGPRRRRRRGDDELGGKVAVAWRDVLLLVEHLPLQKRSPFFFILTPCTLAAHLQLTKLNLFVHVCMFSRSGAGPRVHCLCRLSTRHRWGWLWPMHVSPPTCRAEFN